MSGWGLDVVESFPDVMDGYYHFLSTHVHLDGFLTTNAIIPQEDPEPPNHVILAARVDASEVGRLVNDLELLHHLVDGTTDDFSESPANSVVTYESVEGDDDARVVTPDSMVGWGPPRRPQKDLSARREIIESVVDLSSVGGVTRTVLEKDTEIFMPQLLPSVKRYRHGLVLAPPLLALDPVGQAQIGDLFNGHKGVARLDISSLVHLVLDSVPSIFSMSNKSVSRIVCCNSVEHLELHLLALGG